MKNFSLALVRWCVLRLPALVLGVVGVVFTWEALRVGFASPERVAEYHFGSEAMLYHGGWFYRSQLIYVLSAFLGGLALASLSALLVRVSRQPSRWFWSSLPPFGLAVLAGAAMMLAAWQHNAQGEIHDESGVAWLYWLGIGAPWFVLVYSASLLLVWLGVLAASRLHARGLTSGCS